MATPLLTTKLYIPPVRSDPSASSGQVPSASSGQVPSARVLRTRLAPRLRLIERLNAGLDRKLTLVSAPAASWLTSSQ